MSCLRTESEEKLCFIAKWRIEGLFCACRLHYLPAKGRPNDFNDGKYQSQLPLYARSTTARVWM